MMTDGRPESQVPHDNSRSYAPFAVWRFVRILELSSVCIGVAGMPVMLLSALNGWRLGSFSGGWIGFGMMVVAGLVTPGTRVGLPGPSLPARVAKRRFASDMCPICDQSIFDRHPATGYVDVFVATSIWPAQQCSNCGHDMTIAQTHDR